MAWYRLVKPLCLAALIPAVLATLLVLVAISDSTFDVAEALFVFTFAMASSIAIVALGWLPAYLLLRHFRWSHPVHFALAGFVVGSLAGLIVVYLETITWLWRQGSLVVPLNDADGTFGIKLNVPAWSDTAGLVLTCGMLGLIGALSHKYSEVSHAP
jgi:hypothetical protein